MTLERQALVVGNVALALVLGGLIGAEREAANKPAGFRTHLLVAGAAAVLIHLGPVLAEYFGGATARGELRTDPLRMIEAIVTGISFLGAGTIIRGREDPAVRGLTTAASLLMSGVIGVCVALGQYLLAVGVVALTLTALRGMRWLESRLHSGRK